MHNPSHDRRSLPSCRTIDRLFIGDERLGSQENESLRGVELWCSGPCARNSDNPC
jgi:hypothetical protein